MMREGREEIEWTNRRTLIDRRTDVGGTVDRSMETYYRERGPMVIRRFKTVAV